MMRIGEDVTGKIRIVPVQILARRHVRPRYAGGTCENAIAHTPLPAFPIPGVSAGTPLLAFLLVSKYADHLPPCRKERINARHGNEVTRRKNSEWMIEITELLSPLAKVRQRRIHERCNVIGVDETPIATLAEYKNILQCEGKSVYSSLNKECSFTVVGCWSHARRKLVEVLDGDGKRTQETIATIVELGAVEKARTSVRSKTRTSTPLAQTVRARECGTRTPQPGRASRPRW